MKLILINSDNSRVRHLSMGGWWTRALLSVCCLGIPLGAGFYWGQELNKTDGVEWLTEETVNQWNDILEQQKQEIADTSDETKAKLNALTLRMAELQGRLLRLDALGERLTIMANLDEGEFDFSQPLAIGGPETEALGEAYESPEFLQVVDELFDKIADREQQLETLEALMTKRQIQEEVFVAGRPIKKGWMSSRYGRRTDPFHGKIAWHAGVDFAGKMGSDIIAVASGVVVESSHQGGYGGKVVINHGNGFQTLYAHNKENLVKVGEIVKKGQVIALMGTTGRSTGPHVHFEVYKNGRTVDPASYINRTHR